MQTEQNVPKHNFIEILLNDDLFGFLTTLSESVKEFYKVSKNINKNKTMLINLGEGEVNIIESIQKKLNINCNEIDPFNFQIEKLREIFNSLHLNIISEEKNLIFFFEDARVIFKKIKEKCQEIIMNKRKKINSASKNKISKNYSSSFNYDNKNNPNKKYLNSELNRKIKDFNINLTDNISSTNNEKNIKKDRKSKTLNKTMDSINDDENYDNIHKRNKKIAKSPRYNTKDIRTQNNELEKLNIKFNTIDSKRTDINNDYCLDNCMNNKTNNINIIIKNKDKIISTLKENMNKNNKKYYELLKSVNNMKFEMKKIKEENSKLKQINFQNKGLSNNDKELNINMKISNLLKENNMLKKNIEELKLKKFISPTEYNVNLDFKTNSYNNSQILEKQVEILQKKINNLEKELSVKQKQNKELTSEYLLLSTKHESELKRLSQKNSELSSLLINKQKELLNLKRENINKSSEIESLKGSLNGSNKNQKVIDSSSYKSSFEKKGNSNNSFSNIGNENLNIFIEKYKKENEQLKTTNILHQEKIKNYKDQIKNIYDQDNINITLKSNEECKKLNYELNQKICTLNQQILDKELVLIELNYKVDQLEKQIKEKEIDNKKLSNQFKIIKHNSFDKNNNLKLNEKIKEFEIKNHDLNEEIINLKNENKMLNNKIIDFERINNEYKNKEKTENNIYLLNKEMEKIKNENLFLKSNNQSLNKQIKDILNNNINGNNKEENLKKKDEEIDGLKQLISKLQKEKEKYDEEINLLRRENDRIKNQLIHLSEEYNEIQKQYKDLENKYLQNVKNKSTFSNSDKKSNNKNNIEQKLLKELNEDKKVIEELKKKNLELVSKLESKEIRNIIYDNKSEEGKKSYYEEEFDLKKMAKGAREKNKSQDLNIDYPGMVFIKEKYRELDFYYNSLERLVKKLLLTIQCNSKNKTYILELCKIVGFDLDMTNKILTNKNKKSIIEIFNK